MYEETRHVPFKNTWLFGTEAAGEADRCTLNPSVQFTYKSINIMQRWLYHTMHMYTNLLLRFFSILICMTLKEGNHFQHIHCLLLLQKHYCFSFLFLSPFIILKDLCIMSVSTTLEWVTCKQTSCTWEALVSNFTINDTNTPMRDTASVGGEEEEEGVWNAAEAQRIAKRRKTYSVSPQNFK